MKKEVVIVNGEPEEVFEDGKVDEFVNPRFTEHVREKWNAHAPIVGEPQYVAIHVNGTDSIRVIMEIDSKRSKLPDKIIVPEGKPIPVYIPIRFAKNHTLQKITYSTFRKLITHESTKDIP